MELLIKHEGESTYTSYAKYDWEKSNETRSVVLSDDACQDITSVRFIISSGGGTFASCAEMQFMQSNKEGMDEYTIFGDELYSTLREGVTKEDIDALESPFIKALANQLFEGTYNTEYRAADTFTPVQKAISYSMTSFFTTGGIRGGKKKLDKFYPRSFNMGIRREVYNKLNGFSKMRFGEDIDFSIRIIKSGFKTRLFPDAWVYHKRRTDFRKFWRQVFNSGIARINLYKKYPDSLKLVHLLPAVFTVGVILLTLMFLGGLVGAFVMFQMGYGMEQALPLAISALSLAMLAFYAAVIFLDANCQTGNLWVAALSVRAAFTQLMGYGCGFIKAWWRRCVLGKDEFEAYKRNFYK